MITLVVLAFALVMMLVERIRPGRAFPKVRGWWMRALALNAIQVGIVFVAGHVWDGWMLRHRPWSLDLGPIAGAIVGYIAITFVYYFWHRARHTSNFLWLTLHQVHHSPQRIEVITSFYKHPLEIFLNGILSSTIVYVAVGLDVEAATGAVLLSGLAELVYHWNVRTPHWVGYVFQRPESHCVHHEEGKHTKNYSDLPLWDMLFGTFENPPRFDSRCGFGVEREQQLHGMLLFTDVNAERTSRRV